MSVVIDRSCGISEIIPEKLYLGSQEGAKDCVALKRLGVTHIVNVTKEIKDCGAFRAIRLRVGISDGLQGISTYFDECFDFIEGGKMVFVHCRHGISRSATIVTAYLMRKNCWDFQKSLQYLKERRGIVNPHFYFQVELMAYQEKCNRQNISS